MQLLTILALIIVVYGAPQNYQIVLDTQYIEVGHQNVSSDVGQCTALSARRETPEELVDPDIAIGSMTFRNECAQYGEPEVRVQASIRTYGDSLKAQVKGVVVYIIYDPTSPYHMRGHQALLLKVTYPKYRSRGWMTSFKFRYV